MINFQWLSMNKQIFKFYLIDYTLDPKITPKLNFIKFATASLLNLLDTILFELD